MKKKHIMMTILTLSCWHLLLLVVLFFFTLEHKSWFLTMTARPHDRTLDLPAPNNIIFSVFHTKKGFLFEVGIGEWRDGVWYGLFCCHLLCQFSFFSSHYNTPYHQPLLGIQASYLTTTSTLSHAVSMFFFPSSKMSLYISPPGIFSNIYKKTMREIEKG